MSKFRNYPFYDLFDAVESKLENYVSRLVELSENEKEYLIEISVPGLTKDDIDIKLDKQYLEISYNKEKSRFVQSFEKRYLLPDNSDLDNISAKVENGILVVSIPKIIKRDTKKTIEVK